MKPAPRAPADKQDKPTAAEITERKWAMVERLARWLDMGEGER